jgi:hypothetical protein
MNANERFIDRETVSVRKVLSDKVTPGYDWYVKAFRMPSWNVPKPRRVYEIPQSEAFPFRENHIITIAHDTPLCETVERLVLMTVRYCDETETNYTEHWIIINGREVFIRKEPSIEVLP